MTFRAVRYSTQPSNSVHFVFYLLTNIKKVESRNIEPEYDDNDVKKFLDSLVLKLIEKFKAELMFSDTPERLRDNSLHNLGVPGPLIETDHHELRHERVDDLVLNMPERTLETKALQFGAG